MKWGWYWTAGTSAFQRYHPSVLIQPSSPSCMLPSHAVELSSEPEWLLLQMLCWKARECTYAGRAIEVWVCAQRCVRVCVEDGCRGRERAFSGACTGGAPAWRTARSARSRTTRREGAETDGDSGASRKCREHESARERSRSIVVVPVLLRMLLALLASFTPSCCALAPAMPAQTRAPAHRPPPAVTRMGL